MMTYVNLSYCFGFQPQRILLCVVFLVISREIKLYLSSELINSVLLLVLAHVSVAMQHALNLIHFRLWCPSSINIKFNYCRWTESVWNCLDALSLSFMVVLVFRVWFCYIIAVFLNQAQLFNLTINILFFPSVSFHSYLLLN